MSISLKDRIAGAEHDAVTEESPIAAIFQSAQVAAQSKEPKQAINQASTVTQSQAYPQLRDLPADALDEMEQPFRLYSEKKLEEMKESIIAHGIIQRIIVRPSPDTPGHYQIISGRNRRRAAMRAGYTMVPCEIRDLDDDEARLQMVTTNLDQRDELLPSEKAWAYRIRLEALVHQGKRTSRQTVAKLKSADEVSEDESGRQVQRYIRLTYLTPELLDAVDNDTLGFGAGVSLSYLSEKSQEAVYNYFFLEHKQKISGDLAESLRAAGEKEELTPERILVILSPAVKKPVKINKVSVPMKPLRQFWPAETPAKEIEKQIIEIVTEYFKQVGGGE